MKDFQDFGINIPSGKTGEVYTTCPECSASRKNKSAKCLSVNVEKGVWICFHCGWKGTLKTGQNGKSNPTWSKIAEYIRPTLKTRAQKLDEMMYGFFRNRGIMKETVEAFGVSWDEEVYFPQVEDFKPSVCFPFFRNSELINVKYRGPQKMFRLAKDAERIFFGLDTIVVNGEVAKEVFITEGEMDALSLYEVGFKSVVSVPNGAPSEKSKDFEKQLEFIENSRYKLEGHEKDIIEEVSIFYIAVDSDAPGLKLEEGLIRRLGSERCMRVKWPEGYKDANEVLIGVPAKNLPALGAKGIEDAITKAKHAPVAGIFEPDDYRDKVIELYFKGNPPGFSLGFNGLRTPQGRDIYTVKTKTLTVTTGNYGSGKSEFVEHIECIMAVNEGWRFLVFTAEAPADQAIANLAEKIIGLPFNEGFHKRMEIGELEEALIFVQDHFTFFDTSEYNFSIDKIVEFAEMYVRRKGINGLVIDPWNNVEYSNSGRLRDDLLLGQSLRKLNILKRKCDLWINVVAHPLSLRRDKDGKWPVPTLRDISGGVTWPNMVDFGLIVDRDKEEPNSLVDIHCSKVKFKHLGVLGIGHLEFDPPTGRYYDGQDEHGATVFADYVASKKKVKDFRKNPKTDKMELGWYND